MFLRRYVKIHREDGDIQMEAENSYASQTKEPQDPPEAVKGKEEVFPRRFRGSVAFANTLILYLELLEL